MKQSLTMKTSCAAVIVLTTFAMRAPPAWAQDMAPATTDLPGDDAHGWPRSFEEDGIKFTIYQPQLEKWANLRILARAAVAVEAGASPQPTFGVVWIVGRTEIDKEQRVATIEDLKFARASFPTAPDKADAWLAALRKHPPEDVKTVELDRLEASLAVVRAQQTQQSAPLKNDPPRFIFSERPAILVLVDGKPVLRKAGAADLLRVINTRALLLEDEKVGQFLLAVHDRWLSAPTLDGPWTIAARTPPGAEDLKRDAVADKSVDLYEADAEVTKLLASGAAPTVFAATEPTELIETNGPPQLVSVDGTKLLWVRNTDADVFIDSGTNEHFVLVSGRWFRAPSKAGPWTFVPGNELPADFARIPLGHPAGEVLASVAGTPQAQEAVVANEIPQTATVDRSQAGVAVTYDGGEAQLAPVEGTALQYARNTQTPVVLADGQYYACEDGVWFVSAGANGPWAVAATVPPAIYTIPPSCPIHYATYVRVYDATDAYVRFGYTPGYLGTCIGAGGCVVWGTGWRYNPWIGGVWIGYPWTFGFSVGCHWHSDFGWGLGFGMGARPFCNPWWGPLRHWGPGFAREIRPGVSVHLNINNANIYHNWRGSAVRPMAARPFGVRGGSFPSGRAVRKNDLYAGSDGRVYRHGDDGWQRHEGGTWQRPAPLAQETQRQRAQLDAERNARRQGTTRSQYYRSERPAARSTRTIAPQGQHVRSGPTLAPGLRGGAVRHHR